MWILDRITLFRNARVSFRCPRCHGNADWQKINIFKNAEVYSSNRPIVCN